jgi:hypothetical protein
MTLLCFYVFKSYLKALKACIRKLSGDKWNFSVGKKLCVVAKIKNSLPIDPDLTRWQESTDKSYLWSGFSIWIVFLS